MATVSTSGIVSSTPYVTGIQSAATPQLNITEEEHGKSSGFSRRTIHNRYRDRWACWDGKAKKALTSWDPSCFMPNRSSLETMEYTLDKDIKNMTIWKKCRFLALPKELRLDIYEYVFTDPLRPDMYVDIRRQPSHPPSDPSGIPRLSTPRVKLRLRSKRAAPLSIEILMVNRFIYKEALPILYRSAKFAPMDHEGLLPLFLGGLQPHIRPNIRTISLSLPTRMNNTSAPLSNGSMVYFHWAMTCAQVATLGDTLRTVEIIGFIDAFQQKEYRRMLLYPLCKIKTRKKLVCDGFYSTGNPVDEDARFQELLVQANEELKITAKRREEATKADVRARQKRQAVIDKWAGDRKKDTPEPSRESKKKLTDGEMRSACRSVLQNMYMGPTTLGIDEELSQVPGIKQFERELKHHTKDEAEEEERPVPPSYDTAVEGWDVVSMRSGPSTPKARPKSSVSEESIGDWVDDTASTLIDRDGIDRSDMSDAGSETWEDVGKLPPLGD
ncbi:hypothetical protein P154DRAFT_524872 [Amniculicola lignicola CBS 123094]|uniref:DUF7730 domain-containing protein n=1 Tax=Amniculicola lignicola CBS 123094 TaxID=1392246 RepID=A0A6A5WDY1_9PLEO|nr:hypothetical protein P154DRAFT_524872 [Amniculicola lignicola CBS 123094]